MGLDNFASRTSDRVTLTADDERAFAESGIDLCGGIYSDGEVSFRGKVYLFFVMEVTEEWLGAEWLPPATVAEMAAKLASCDSDTAADLLDLDQRDVPSPGEIRDLQRFFRICAERGLGLIGWS
jgi:hypothetical protein